MDEWGSRHNSGAVRARDFARQICNCPEVKDSRVGSNSCCSVLPASGRFQYWRGAGPAKSWRPFSPDTFRRCATVAEPFLRCQPGISLRWPHRWSDHRSGTDWFAPSDFTHLDSSLQGFEEVSTRDCPRTERGWNHRRHSATLRRPRADYGTAHLRTVRQTCVGQHL